MRDLFTAIEFVHVDAPMPMLTPVRRRVDDRTEPDPVVAVHRELERLRGSVHEGMRIAVTVGSRGVANLLDVTRAAVDWLCDAGAKPFLVPAMGSHGGATAEGQAKLLAHLGVTEATMRAPVLSTMDTVGLGRVTDGPMAHLDANVAAADAVLLINRVKQHTDFDAPVESGLAKILAIGLGKQHGAEALHSYGPAQMARLIPAVARHVVDTGVVLGGLGLVENSSGNTASVRFVPPTGIGGDEEASLLTLAKQLTGRIPFDQLDVLVLDEFGKDKSGAGIDTKVIGRLRVNGVPEPERPRITNVAALELTSASQGNAVGIGLADFVPRRVIDDTDLHAMYTNALTAGLVGVQRMKIPTVLPTDRDAVAAAIRCCGRPDLENVRLVRMHDTMDTEHLLVSDALLAEVQAADDLEIAGDPSPTTFDHTGRITPWG